MAKQKNSTDQLIAHIIEGIENNKGLNIKLLDLRDIENSICEYFIICSGTSNTHVDAIAGSIQTLAHRRRTNGTMDINGLCKCRRTYFPTKC